MPSCRGQGQLFCHIKCLLLTGVSLLPSSWIYESLRVLTVPVCVRTCAVSVCNSSHYNIYSPTHVISAGRKLNYNLSAFVGRLTDDEPEDPLSH